MRGGATCETHRLRRIRNDINKSIATQALKQRGLGEFVRLQKIPLYPFFSMEDETEIFFCIKLIITLFKECRPQVT